jgi:hypothetical protein
MSEADEQRWGKVGWNDNIAKKFRDADAMSKEDKELKIRHMIMGVTSKMQQGLKAAEENGEDRDRLMNEMYALAVRIEEEAMVKDGLVDMVKNHVAVVNEKK